MLGKKIINTGGVACTTDTAQILDGGTTESLALYRFEDNANDTASSTGKFNKGSIFNGSSSKIALPAILPTSSTADSSVSFWFKYSGGQSGTGTLFSSFGGNTSQPGYHLGLEAAYTYGGVSYPDGSLYLTGYSMGTGSGVNGTTSYADGKWHHVVVTYDFSTGVLSCFVDNASSATLSVSFTSRPSTIGPFSQSGDIGYQAHGGPHRYAKCSIDQFRIFNKDLTSTERTTLYNETTTTANTLQVLGDTSCVAAYTFEGNANDLDTSTPQNGTAANVTYDYSGTLSGATYVTGKFGKAASFDGTNDYISADNPNASGGARSFSAWIKTTSTSFQTIIGNGGASHARGLNMFVYNNKLYSTSGNGSGENYGPTSSADVNTGSWVHCALTMSGTASGSTLKTYVNGTLDGTHTTSVAITDTSDAFRIGGRYINGSYASAWFNGQIDQVRIFSKELSPGEVNSLYNETTTSAALGTISNPSTVAYYKMADATDETGSYNGTASNVDFNVQGKYGFAGKFNGSSGRIEVPNASKPSLSTATVSFWLKTSSTNTQGLVGEGYSGSHWGNLQIYLASNKLNARSGNASSAEDAAWASTSNVNTGAWVHCAVTISGNTSQIFINGTLETTKTLTVTRAATTNPFTIGQIYANGNLFSSWTNDCEIDQVRIFNKTISADEVTKLYNEIQCANTIATPESYFNTVLYTGTSSTQSITGAGFQPGLVWLKQRNSSQNHGLFDTVRGVNNFLMSNSTSAANTRTTDTLSSFDANGFTLTPYSSDAFINYSGRTMTAWNWKAGSSNVTNNDGTITSTVSASPESGFSIVKYTGNATSGATFGHGLNSKPELILIKNLDHGGNYHWTVYSGPNGATGLLYLNLTDAFTSTSSRFNNTEPTSSVVTLGNDGTVNDSGDDHIAYCFANVDGYQRIGSYVGNGSANGPFIYTGFEPKFVMFKRTDSTSSWYMLDNNRIGSNGYPNTLFANLSNTEENTQNSNGHYPIKFLSNGFQILQISNGYNASGGAYMYLAIAANPDTTAPTKANSFNTLLYTGNDSNDRSITGLGFKPDFIWIKRRNSAESHALYDSARGPNLQLSSDTTGAEATNSGSYLGMSSFDSDGFNVGNNGGTNRAPNTYVAWAWKALDHDRNLTAINTNGTIPSIVSANPEAGFSIVNWSGSISSDAQTVGHGLSSPPELVILKNRDVSDNWYVFVNGVTSTSQNLKLNTDDGVASSSTMWGAGMTSTVAGIRPGSFVSSTSNKVIMYCWHSVAEYSKIESYSGDNSTDRLITTGFDVSFVMIKKTNGSSHWQTFDIRRGGNKQLDFDSFADEFTASSAPIEFVSNGFRIKTNYTTYNATGGEYIYMAFK